MTEEPKKIEFRDKKVVLFKDVLKQAIDQYIDRQIDEAGGDDVALYAEDIDTNALAGELAKTVFHNLGLAGEATTTWFKWLKESRQI